MTSSSACRSALKRNTSGGNLIDAEQLHAVGVSRVQSSQPSADNDRCASSAARDSPSTSNGRLSVTTSAVPRKASDAETQTPPSLKTVRRSLVDYSNMLSSSPCSTHPAQLPILPL